MGFLLGLQNTLFFFSSPSAQKASPHVLAAGGFSHRPTKRSHQAPLRALHACAAKNKSS